jgi:hypothetical protein
MSRIARLNLRKLDHVLCRLNGLISPSTSVAGCFRWNRDLDFILANSAENSVCDFDVTTGRQIARSKANHAGKKTVRE